MCLEVVMTKLKGFITDAFGVLLDVSIYHAATYTFCLHYQ